MLQASTA
jgi:casein kinase II subunit beta